MLAQYRCQSHMRALVLRNDQLQKALSRNSRTELHIKRKTLEQVHLAKD